MRFHSYLYSQSELALFVGQYTCEFGPFHPDRAYKTRGTSISMRKCRLCLVVHQNTGWRRRFRVTILRLTIEPGGSDLAISLGILPSSGWLARNCRYHSVHIYRASYGRPSGCRRLLKSKHHGVSPQRAQPCPVQTLTLYGSGFQRVRRTRMYAGRVYVHLVAR